MYALLVLSVVAASFNSIVMNRARMTRKNDILNFNFFGALVWCVLLFIANKTSVTLNLRVLIWGVVYGVTQALFIMFKTAAMSSGSVTVTTLIGNSSLLISVFATLVLWNERVSVVDIICLLALLAAIFLCNYKKSGSVYTPRWKYYVVCFFLLAAGVGLVFKAFGKAGGLEYCGDMMFVAAVVMAVCFFLVSMLTGGAKILARESKKRFLWLALLGGLLSCLYNRLNIYLSGSMDAIIFFPVFNGGVVLLSAVLSMLICRERLSWRQWTGILLGITAICGIGIL